MKCLFASAVGKSRKHYFNKIFASFGTQLFDYIVFAYDGAQFSKEVKVIREKGKTCGYALKHLTDDVVDKYDLIFLWVDDLEIDGFNVNNFIKVFNENGFGMAQPSINKKGIIANWEVVRQVPNGKARITNFVETQAMVFTKKAFKQFRTILKPDCESGWGYDLLIKHLLPNIKQGVIDAESVGHMEYKNTFSSEGPEQLKRLEQYYNIKLDYDCKTLKVIKNETNSFC